MRELDLREAAQRRKVQNLRLIEIGDLTRQLQQAADRRDETSVSLLLDMREEPLSRLRESDASLRKFLANLPREDADRLRELLEGAEARTPEEKPLMEENARFRRLLDQVREQDKRLSLSMGGEKSAYYTGTPQQRGNVPGPLTTGRRGILGRA